LQTSLQRRDSSRCEQTGQNREASSCPLFSGLPDKSDDIVPEFEVPTLRSSASGDATTDFTPLFKPGSTAAPL